MRDLTPATRGYAIPQATMTVDISAAVYRADVIAAADTAWNDGAPMSWLMRPALRSPVWPFPQADRVRDISGAGADAAVAREALQTKRQVAIDRVAGCEEGLL